MAKLKSTMRCGRSCFGKWYARQASERRDRSVKFLIEDYKSGVGTNSLAKKYKISIDWVIKLLDGNGVQRRTQSEANFLIKDRPRCEKRKCKMCDNVFPWYPSYGSHRGMYCSQKCRANDPLQVEKQRRVAIRNIKTGKLKSWNTKPELMMKSLLDDMGSNSVQQFELGGFLYDFYWPELHMLVEVDGDFWHGHNIPESKLKPYHIRNIERDKVKEELALSSGYDFLRIRQSDLEKNFEMLKEMANKED